ncbi:cobyric acid synthase, partial [Acinetobacter baumannii]|nr:cobyric acid synthase [Acinetobacter baumannii]
KFRGDETILAPGLKTLEDMTGKPVVGVVPYLDVDIDDEDSLTERFTAKNQPALIDLVVIRTPRISNFTDFSVFESIEGVRV